jgi:hypothetical protein
MRKILVGLGLAAMCVSVPASATPMNLTVERLTKLNQEAPTICRIAFEKSARGEDSGKYISSVGAQLGYSTSEIMVMLALCMSYGEGMKHGIEVFDKELEKRL